MLRSCVFKVNNHLCDGTKSCKLVLDFELEWLTIPLCPYWAVAGHSALFPKYETAQITESLLFHFYIIVSPSVSF